MKKWLPLLLLPALAAAAPPASESPLAPVRRFALLVGVNDGGPHRARLRYAVTDAQAFGKVLEELGGVIKSALRSGDVAARFGGEEFAAFLLDAGYPQALVAAERVRRAVEQHQFTSLHTGSDHEEHFHITMSIGIAGCPDDAKDPIELIELADSALYRAKSNGRNQASAYQPSLTVSEKPLPPRRTN